MNKIILIGLILIILLIYFSPLPKSSFDGSVNLVYSLYQKKFKSKFTLTEGKKLQSIDMVYAITMPQRKEYITTQINSMELMCKYLDAIKPNDLTVEETNTISDVNKLGSRFYKLPTRLSHLLSFTMCCIDAITNGYSTIIIFEDDIIINIDTQTLGAATTEFIKSDNDIFYMGYCFLNCKQSMDKNKYTYIIPLTDPSILCNHATCIKVDMLHNLIDYCFPMKKPTDELFTDYFHSKKIKVCIPKKSYFDQVPRDQMESLNESTVKLELCR